MCLNACILVMMACGTGAETKTAGNVDLRSCAEEVWNCSADHQQTQSQMLLQSRRKSVDTDYSEVSSDDEKMHRKSGTEKDNLGELNHQLKTKRPPSHTIQASASEDNELPNNRSIASLEQGEGVREKLNSGHPSFDSKKEVKSKKVELTNISRQNLHIAFERLDTNKDRHLSWLELENDFEGRTKDENMTQLLEELWRTADVDGNSLISAEEFQEVFVHEPWVLAVLPGPASMISLHAGTRAWRRRRRSDIRRRRGAIFGRIVEEGRNAGRDIYNEIMKFIDPWGLDGKQYPKGQCWYNNGWNPHWDLTQMPFAGSHNAQAYHQDASHNSGSGDCGVDTQVHTIKEQGERGIRFFDIDVKDSSCKSYHAYKTYATTERIMDQIDDLLQFSCPDDIYFVNLNDDKDWNGALNCFTNSAKKIADSWSRGIERSKLWVYAGDWGLHHNTDNLHDIKLLEPRFWEKRTFQNLRGSVILMMKNLNNQGHSGPKFTWGGHNSLCGNLRDSNDFAVVDHYGGTRCLSQQWLPRKVSSAGDDWKSCRNARNTGPTVIMMDISEGISSGWLCCEVGILVKKATVMVR